MMRRLFVAIDIPEDAREKLKSIQDALRPDIPGAKWVEPGGMHVTLKFLGPVEEAVVNDIEAVLEEAVRDKEPFKFSIRGLGGFPTKTRPRVVWAGIEDEGAMAGLAKPVERSMEWLGFKPEDRDFHPHITLARIKTPRRLDNPDLLPSAGQYLEIPNLLADKLVLFESRLSPRGATYSVVKAFPLS
jgi:2'-5' RNA ligase